MEASAAFTQVTTPVSNSEGLALGSLSQRNKARREQTSQGGEAKAGGRGERSGEDRVGAEADSRLVGKVERSGLAEVRAGGPAPSLDVGAGRGPFCSQLRAMPSLTRHLAHCLLSSSCNTSH